MDGGSIDDVNMLPSLLLAIISVETQVYVCSQETTGTTFINID